MNPWNIFAAAAVAAGLFFGSTARSEEATPATLATLPARLDALEKEFAEAVAAAQKTLDAQVVAGRIKDPAAQSLRWSLRNVAQNVSSLDPRSLVSTAKVPSDNEEMRTAMTTLDDAIGALQGRRVAALKEAQADLKLRVMEAVSTAERTEPVETLLGQVDALHEAASKGIGNSYGESSQQVQQASSLLSALQRVIAAEREGEPRSLGAALSNLRSVTQNSTRLAQSEVQARIGRTVKPLLAAVEAARQALEKSLIENQTPTQTTGAFARYEEAVKRASDVRSGVETGREPDESRMLNAYRPLLQAQAAAARGDLANAQRQMEAAQSPLGSLGSEGERLREWTVKWRSTLNEKMAAVQAEQVEKIRVRLNAIKSAEELAKFAAELAAPARREGNDGMDGSWTAGLGQELGILSAQWTSGNVGEISQYRLPGVPGDRRAQLTREINAIRSRAERESLSRLLRAPELLQKPLADQPLESAYESLCDDLAKRGEWRRLYRVIENRGARRLHNYGNATDPTMQALHHFFAGQNFELAEQWSDAVASYKAVLKTTSERIPLKETSERLKALKKEHPEAFVETAPAAKRP